MYNIIINSTTRTFIVNSSGRRGYPGAGLEPGGTTGQVLAKKSASNNDTEWVDTTPQMEEMAIAYAIIF